MPSASKLYFLKVEVFHAPLHQEEADEAQPDDVYKLNVRTMLAFPLLNLSQALQLMY
jgi:hypothetical protein